jgi:molybdopterin synthase sulfur carrier subunit
MTAMVRVELPAPLRLLANTAAELQLTIPGAVTLDAVIDAIESAYPALAGTIRDHNRQRRPFIRFFACEQDISRLDPTLPLPGPVARGAEPLLVIGAIAGG